MSTAPVNATRGRISDGKFGSSKTGLKRASIPREVAGSSHSRRGGKLPGPEWQFATNLGKFIDWKCNYCGEEKSGEHLV